MDSYANNLSLKRKQAIQSSRIYWNAMCINLKLDALACKHYLLITKVDSIDSNYKCWIARGISFSGS